MAEINVGAISEALNNKSDIDLNNLNGTGTEKFDGEWVDAQIQLIQTVNFTGDTTTNIDLSEYLPNDGYRYEVILAVRITTGSSSGNGFTSYASGTGTTFTPYVCGTVTRTNSSVDSVGTILCIIEADRVLKFRLSSTGTSSVRNMSISNYRRIGKTN